MFNDIEREYKNKSNWYQFIKWYSISATIIFIASTIAINFINKYIIYELAFIALILFVLFYFYICYKKVIRNIKISKKTKIKERFNIYIEEKNRQRINNLILILNEYQIKNKSDLKLVIDYYNSNKYIKLESSPMS